MSHTLAPKQRTWLDDELTGDSLADQIALDLDAHHINLYTNHAVVQCVCGEPLGDRPGIEARRVWLRHVALMLAAAERLRT